MLVKFDDGERFYYLAPQKIKIGDKIQNGTNIEIKMTLTAPGCGMGPMLVDEVKAKVNGVKNVKEVNVELVWEPQWSQDMMSESAKLDTGMY